MIVNAQSTDQRFDIPVVLLLFKRKEGAVRIIERIKEVRPLRIYLLSDAGRDQEEMALVEECRQAVESCIDWDCEIVKRYSSTNIGVYENIGLGAKWVFEREDRAIFLEDDNLPEVSFFEYCKEMLERYEDDERILWVCGTNYLGDGSFVGDTSYFFTRSLLPCGWASWSHKFLSKYDFDFDLMDMPGSRELLKREYKSKALYRQQLRSVEAEIARRDNRQKYRSWDYHMIPSIRLNDCLGIVPCMNQIKNIGVDDCSIHGGTSFDSVMTKRFCGMDSYPLSFPLVHPSEVEVNDRMERELDKIILFPVWLRIKGVLARAKNRLLGR